MNPDVDRYSKKQSPEKQLRKAQKNNILKT